MPTTIEEDGTVVVSNSASFPIIGASPVAASLPIVVLPSFPVAAGRGRLVHPTLGSFDYEHKPDEWVNIDGDVIIPPIWASTRTLTGAANVLWSGHIEDVVVVERWLPIGGLSMPITMARMLMMLWTNPVDPDVGFIEWWPNYTTTHGYKVAMAGLTSGGDGITLNDVINARDVDGQQGWLTYPITLTMRILGRVG